MGLTLAEKILKEHLIEGEMEEGKEIALRCTDTLTQDATGTLAYLQFEAMGVEKIQVERAVSFVDHNMLQTGFENPDDHIYLQDVAAKYGIYFSRPGNGICHQVYLERFARPGKILLGSDSHTPTAGGAGMIAIGVGGLDIALALAGEPFWIQMPRIVGIHLKGSLPPWVTAKDIILELLRRLTVKGGVGKIFEYFGEGIKCLSVPERGTIANMGAELGATTSIFPSDEVTLQYFKRQKREKDWIPLAADPDAQYSEIIEIDLSSLKPLIAQPHSPDNVVAVEEIAGIPVNQVAIGSCTNSSYIDLMRVGMMLRGKTVHPRVSAALTPGSRQVLLMMTKTGALADIIQSGMRILESACGPCIGMGFAPPSGGVSVRSYNRNFYGRSGTKDARVYLASAETCVACALTGEITDPSRLGIPWQTIEEPEEYIVDDSLILPPAEEPEKVQIRRGPNIKPIPELPALQEKMRGKVLIKVGDNISTDEILPAGSKVLPLRSNIPAISEYTFSVVDASFPKRAKEWGGGFIVGGENYGQGSSREHAALAPRYLGVKAVLAKSFSRIHLGNLINFGIIPLRFINPQNYEILNEGDEIEITISWEEKKAHFSLPAKNVSFEAEIVASDRQKEILKAGGSLSFVKRKWKKSQEG
ncbi:MAG: aconitate hydratase [bacterium JZ-2024 1]